MIELREAPDQSLESTRTSCYPVLLERKSLLSGHEISKIGIENHAFKTMGPGKPLGAPNTMATSWNGTNKRRKLQALDRLFGPLTFSESSKSLPNLNLTP